MRGDNRKIELSVVMIAFVLTALLASGVKSATVSGQNNDGDATVSQQLQNGGFETVTTSVYQAINWSTNNGGQRDLRGDMTGRTLGVPDGKVDMLDVGVVSAAFGAKPGSSNWNTKTNPQGPDLDGDGVVTMADIGLVTSEFGQHMGKDAYCADGEHSWFTSGGGDYLMYQELNVNASIAVAGERVIFKFRFYPQSVAADGSINNARAEILYKDTGGNWYIASGAWVAPTSLGWWEASVTKDLPFNTCQVIVFIHGTPDFKAWVDSAWFNTYNYNLYYKVPSYANQGSYPENNTITYWTDGSAVGALGNENTGLVLLYALDNSGAGAGKTAYVNFNNDPPTGNSPQVSETGGFSIGAYWFVDGHLGNVLAEIVLELDLYYFQIGVGWVYTGKSARFGFDSIGHPNQEVVYFGSVSYSFTTPPSGSEPTP